MRCIVIGACLVTACSSTQVKSVSASKELIPAEWTVAEDTSASGEVTTASLQLPAARQISGLPADAESRLVLRCIDHQMQAFIATDSADSSAADSEAEPDTSGTMGMVAIQLDSPPACE